MEPNTGSFVVESFWPGVEEEDVRRLERRLRALAEAGARYVGSILMQQDEVVLWQIEGELEEVRRLAERAGVPFERILAASISTNVPLPPRRNQ